MPMALKPVVVLLLLFWCATTYATKPATRTIQGFSQLAQGRLSGLSLSYLGEISRGPHSSEIAKIPGTLVSYGATAKGLYLAATANPAQLWRLSSKKKPELVFAAKEPIFTSIIPLDDGRVAVLSAPKGGVYFLDPAEKREPVYVPIPDVDILLQGAAVGTTLYLVGGGESGKLLRLERGQTKPVVVTEVPEGLLRSLWLDPKGKDKNIYLGGGQKGTLYKWAHGKLEALYSNGQSEVTSIAVDSGGRIFASLFAGEEHAGGTLPAATVTEPAPERNVKFSEVVRVDPNGAVQILWHSTKDGAYSSLLIDDGARLLVGTGPRGILYDLDPNARLGAAIAWQAPESTELISLESIKSSRRVWVGASHQGIATQLSFDRLTQNGNYLSEPIDAIASASFGNVIVDEEIRPPNGAEIWLRTGNTQKPDETWGAWVKRDAQGHFKGLRDGRYAQIKVTLSDAKFRQLRIVYLAKNHAPEIGVIRVLPPGYQLAGRHDDSLLPALPVTFDQMAFENVASFVPSFPSPQKMAQGSLMFDGASRAVYAWADDADEDALRYRFVLDKVGAPRKDHVLLQDFGPRPFVNFDSSKLGDGRYRVGITVDDMPDNGSKRAKQDMAWSGIFTVHHDLPKFKEARAQKEKEGIHVHFVVEAKAPISAVRCILGDSEWASVDPIDGLNDWTTETYDATLPGSSWFESVGCEAIDHAGQKSRIDIQVR